MSRILILISMLLACTVQAIAAPPPAALRFNIEQTVVKMPLAEGVTPEDAIEALKSKAIELNMKFVAHQPLSRELAARGIDDPPRLEIFQFCNPGDAYEMVRYNPIFAAYMPCRIALVEDRKAGKTWLMMLDLNLLIENTPLPPKLRAIAERVSQTLMQILEAGATGEF